ncbi:hypothetical protein CC86DRAFT_433706 [Ophiobolus disseminans]|uniref:Suppressor of anucleate metulae protein B n=1 Tax=Ophiobolus disseminans TaxID=1469910 RepID=A0A6A6ZDV6_9PLEO|nr:hypothetical protein CC86DRAFT_433706 [Ophiobolus disseminans]
MASLCAMCSNVGPSGCHSSARYYSRECQKLDWSVHKLLCKTIKASFTNDECSYEHHGIYFAENDIQPRFVWLHVREIEDGDFAVDLSVLSNLTDFRIKQGLKTSTVLQRPLGKLIMTGFRFRELPNGTLQTYGDMEKSFTKIDDELSHMLGPILAYGMELADHTGKFRKPLDLDMNDFRHLVDFFKVRLDATMLQNSEQKSGEGIKGVRLNSKGNQHVFGFPAYEAKNMGIDNFDIDPSCYSIPCVPKKLGLEFIVLKKTDALSWRSRRFGGQPANANWPFSSKCIDTYVS